MSHYSHSLLPVTLCPSHLTQGETLEGAQVLINYDQLDLNYVYL